jgi:NADH:ubiquinone oxidoreductase subunit 3 (subunit A)
MGSDYIAVTLVILVGVGVALQFLALAKFIGERRPSAAKNITYEAGSDPVGDPRGRFPVRFYPLSILFVVFDIEAAFFYPWAVNFRQLSCAGPLHAGVCQAGVSFLGFGAALTFMAVLLVALVYAWRKGVIGWG